MVLERLTQAIMSLIFVEMLTLAIIRWDEANKEKVRLEEKQRGVRKKREQEAELAAQVHFYNSLRKFEQIHKSNIYNGILQEGRTVDPIEPHWFKLVPDPYNGNKMIHEYRGDVSSFMQQWAIKECLHFP